MQPAPSIFSFFPYSTLMIIGILLAFRYELVMDMIQIVSDEFGVKRNATIVILLALIVVVMILVQKVWSFVYYFYANRAAEAAAKDLYTKERNALIALFNSMEGKLWRDKTRWCSDEPTYKWKGVKVDRESGRVNKILLAENNLGGSTNVTNYDYVMLQYGLTLMNVDENLNIHRQHTP
jgi:hypothetical protein